MSWHADEAFWARWGAALEEPDSEEARRAVEGIVDIARIPAGGRVLDVGCGHGRHSLALARLGFKVTALDLSARRLRRIQDVAEAESLEVEIVRRDMVAFSRPRHFHAILWAGDAVGLFADPETDRRVMEQLFLSLKPGGRLIVAPRGKEVLARGLQEQRWHWLDGGTLILEERRIDDGFGWLRVRLSRVREGAETIHAEAAWRLYAGTELEVLLRRANFSKLRLYGDFARCSYDLRAQRLVAVAER